MRLSRRASEEKFLSDAGGMLILELNALDDVSRDVAESSVCRI